MLKNDLNRRKFVEKLSKSTMGLTLLSVIPFSGFITKENKNLVRVKINPSAVKRNPKG